MKEKLRVNDFMSIFLAFLMVALILDGTFLAYVFRDEVRRGQTRARQEASESAARVTDYLAGLIRDEILLGEYARSSTWAIKLNSEMDVFDRDFTYYRQQDIRENFLFRPVGLDNAVYSRAMIFRRRNLAISRNYWGDPLYYLNMLEVPRNLREQVLSQILACRLPTQIECRDEQGSSCFDRNLLFIIPLRPSSYLEPQVYLCTVFNAANILKRVEAMLPEGVKRFSLVNGESETVLMETGEGGADGRRLEQAIFNTPWKAVFEIDETSLYMNPAAMREHLVVFGVLLLAGAALSYLLARLTYRPLRQLLRKVNGNPDDKNAFLTLNHSIDSMLERRQEDQKAAAIRQLLMGCFEGGERLEELVQFRDSMYFRVMILSSEENRQMDDGVLQCVYQELQRGEQVSWQASEMLDGGVALILAAGTEERVRAASKRVQGLLEGEYWSVSLFFGEILYGLIGVSVSYQEARRKQFYLHHGMPRYYFPFDWESQLLDALRKGRLNVAEDILVNLRQENEKALQAGKMDQEDMMQMFNCLTSDLQRCVREMGRGDGLPVALTELHTSGNLEEMWGILLDGIRQMSVPAPQGSADSLDQQIVDYIQQHFDQPELSITTLQEAFGISSATTINKYIRRLTGQTFQACLIRFRMDRAKELVNDPKLRIADVARMVGYENESSFRRTFQRYTGCRVQDYQ